MQIWTKLHIFTVFTVTSVTKGLIIRSSLLFLLVVKCILMKLGVRVGSIGELNNWMGGAASFY